MKFAYILFLSTQYDVKKQFLNESDITSHMEITYSKMTFFLLHQHEFFIKMIAWQTLSGNFELCTDT